MIETVTWATEAHYIGTPTSECQEREWESEDRAREVYAFLTKRASTDWVRLVKKTTTEQRDLEASWSSTLGATDEG